MREARAARLRDSCQHANDLMAQAAAAVRLRNKDMDEFQGPTYHGKFTYTELAQITGMSRSRVNQIISGRRKAKT